MVVRTKTVGDERLFDTNTVLQEVIFHSVAFILYLAASITFLVEIQRRSRYYGSYYEAYLAAAVSILFHRLEHALARAKTPHSAFGGGWRVVGSRGTHRLGCILWQGSIQVCLPSKALG